MYFVTLTSQKSEKNMCGSGFTSGSSREHGYGSWKCVFIFLGICWIINWRFTVISVIFRQLPKAKGERLSILDFFFWNQLNYCSQNSWRARDSWRADEDEVGGLDRIAMSPSFPYLLYTIFSSSNDSPLPDIFSTMFFLRYRGWWRLSFLNMKAKFTTSIFLHRNN